MDTITLDDTGLDIPSYSDICWNCVYVPKDSSQTCAAFPNGIPTEILTGEFDHTTKHPDQNNDIVFEEEKTVK